MERKKNDPENITKYYMENYREMQRYIREAVSEASQVGDIDGYSISAEKAYLSTIRECRAETVILMEHINRAMQSLKEEAIEGGEEYKYKAFEDVYVHGKSYEEIAREMECGRNTPKKWCKQMTERLSVKLFGAKALENKINCVEIRENLNKTGSKVGEKAGKKWVNTKQ